MQAYISPSSATQENMFLDHYDRKGRGVGGEGQGGEKE